MSLFLCFHWFCHCCCHSRCCCCHYCCSYCHCYFCRRWSWWYCYCRRHCCCCHCYYHWHKINYFPSYSQIPFIPTSKSFNFCTIIKQLTYNLQSVVSRSITVFTIFYTGWRPPQRSFADVPFHCSTSKPEVDVSYAKSGSGSNDAIHVRRSKNCVVTVKTLHDKLVRFNE